MKADHKRSIDSYTASRGEFDVVTVPAMHHLAIDGHGDPNTPGAYSDAIATIYPVAYRLKFFSKNELERDYTVMPLEAQWWSDDMESFTSARDKSAWDWTAMCMLPDWISGEHVDAAVRAVGLKGGAPSLDRLRLQPIDEGMCVQTLHVGSYDDEAPVLDTLHNRFIPSKGLRMTGKHHEIYLSDARRTPPHKLKTILRQPVAFAAG